jgi:hypothetical protein
MVHPSGLREKGVHRLQSTIFAVPEPDEDTITVFAYWVPNCIHVIHGQSNGWPRDSDLGTWTGTASLEVAYIVIGMIAIELILALLTCRPQQQQLRKSAQPKWPIKEPGRGETV